MAAFLWAVSNTIDKFILTKLVREPLLPLIILGILGLVAATSIYLVFGLSYLSYLNIGIAIIAGVIYVVSIILYFKALKLEEVSRVVPLWYLAPLFILILAASFLNEAFTPLKYFGIVSLVMGAFLLSIKKFKINFSKAFWFMILSALCISINAILSKYLLNITDFWTIFSWTRIGSFMATVPIMYFYFNELKKTVKRNGNKVVYAISISESLNLIATLSITIATSLGFVTLVDALSSLHPLFLLIFTVLLSVFYPKLLKEEITKSTLLLKFVAIIMIVIGAILIA